MALDSAPLLHRFHFTSFDEKETKVPAAVADAVTSTAAIVLEPLHPQPQPALPLILDVPVITETDVQNARTEAQALGYRDGYAAAQSKMQKETESREDAVKALLEVIANRITLAAESHTQKIKEREVLMGKLVIAVSRKIAGEALKREPYLAVETLMRDCMALIAGASKLKVTVSSALLTGLRQRIDMLKPLLQGFSGEIMVEEDAALLDQDCRVEWGNGYGERSAETLWTIIEGIVLKMNVNS